MRGSWVLCLLLLATPGAWAAEESTPAPEVPGVAEPRGWIGVLLGDSVDGGVGIAALVPGGPAARAGLRSGDVIVSANGRPVPGQESLGVVMGALKPGDRLDLAVLRGGRTVRAMVVLGRRNERILLAPEPPIPPAPASVPPPPIAARRAAPWGIEAAEVTPALRRHFGAPEDAGVLVVRVDPDAAADRAGIAVGDIVFELGGREIRTVAEIEAGMLSGRSGDEPLRARLVRDGEVRELVLPRVAPSPAMAGRPAAAPVAETDRERLKRALATELAALERRVEELRRRLGELEGQR